MLGLIADIHGNAWALDAVIADARRRGVSAFVNLGDALYGPLAPRRTFDLLQQMNIVAEVSGNQDRLILEGTGNPTLDWVRDDLGAEPLKWLRNLPKTASFDDRLLCHGTPSSDTTYLLEDVRHGFARIRSDADILSLLENVQSHWIFCGHSHLQHLVTLSSGQTIVNPGSLGLPAYDDEKPVRHAMETFSPHARYAIVESAEVSFHAVKYDWNSAARRATELGREDWAWSIVSGRGAPG